MSSRRIGLLVNPTSGRGRGGRSAPEVAARLSAGGVEVVPIEGVDAADAEARMVAAVEAGLTGLVACGGDGTVNMALQHAVAADIPLGIIPVGTGDDIARSLSLPRKDIAAAVNVVLSGATRRVDVGEVVTADAGRRLFLGVLSAGFDSMVNERANRMTFPRGQAKYMAAIVAELGTFAPVPYRLTLDDQYEDVEGMLVAIGNGVSYGGGMKVCPSSVMDDGLFHVMLLRKVSKPTFLRVFPTVFRGTHLKHPQVSERPARSVALTGEGQVAYADGERMGLLPISASVLPSAVSVFVPRPSAE